MSTALHLAALLAEPDPSLVPTSPTQQTLTLIAGVIAGLITLATTIAGLRRRRAAEAELAVPDPENSTTRLRERLASVEERLDAYREHGLPDRVTKTEARLDEQARRISDLEEQMSLRRAADVVFEADQAPRRRRRPE
jgi:hypothetical protein